MVGTFWEKQDCQWKEVQTDFHRKNNQFRFESFELLLNIVKYVHAIKKLQTSTNIQK